MDHAELMIRNREAIPPDIDDATAAGAATRRRYGSAMVELNTPQYACAGLNFGYFYDRSPIIVDDGVAPRYTMDRFEESWVPGCRVPHRWLADGASTHDVLGDGYTVLGNARAVDSVAAAAWVDMANHSGVPANVVVLDGDEGPGSSEVAIVRPDGHIAYRGSDVDSTLLLRLTGKG